MKKIISYITLLVFVMQLISGCKSSTTSKKPTSPLINSERATPPLSNQEKTKTYFYTEGDGLQSLVNDALAQPEVQQARSFLEGEGYTFYPDKCIATKQVSEVSMDNLGPLGKALSQSELSGSMTLVALAFGIGDSAKAAYIAFGRKDDKTMISVAKIWFSEGKPEPGYEQITELGELWIKDVTQASLSGKSSLASIPVVLSSPFCGCWLRKSAQGCLACVAGCILTDGGYLHCLAICCGGSIGFGALSCLSTVFSPY